MADEKYGIATGYNSQLIQDYLKYADNSLLAKQNAAQSSLDTSRNAMFDALGRQQLQTERDIAKRRIMAQRSGMTSSQLAAQEMQNIMVGQMGAQQVAQQYREQQSALEQQYAGGLEDNRAQVMQMLNQNANSVAAIDAQRFSASAVEQMRELFPNATETQLNILARQYLGFDISKSEKTQIANVAASGQLASETEEFANKYSDKNVVPANLETALQNPEPLTRDIFEEQVMGRTADQGFYSRDAFKDYIAAYNRIHNTTIDFHDYLHSEDTNTGNVTYDSAADYALIDW